MKSKVSFLVFKEKDIPIQRHVQLYPNCPFVCGQIVGVNMSPPNMDDDHPIIQLMKQVDEVIKKVSHRHSFAFVNDRLLSLYSLYHFYESPKISKPDAFS